MHVCTLIGKKAAHLARNDCLYLLNTVQQNRGLRDRSNQTREACD
jgi:hypothetical protein